MFLDDTLSPGWLKRPNLPKIDQSSVTITKSAIPARCAMEQNLQKYQCCHFSTVSGFDPPKLEYSVLKSLKIRIMEDRKAKSDAFFNNEKESERKAREINEKQKQYETDKSNSEKILDEIRKLETAKQQKSQHKRDLFNQFKEISNQKDLQDAMAKQASMQQASGSKFGGFGANLLGAGSVLNSSSSRSNTSSNHFNIPHIPNYPSNDSHYNLR